MALGRGKDTLPFQLAVQEETNPPKREVSSGQEALLTPSAGVPSCPPPTSPKQSPHPTRNFQIFRSPGLHQSSLNPFQTSSSPPSRLTRFLPHTHTEASSNLDQPKHTPRLPKQRHRPATLGGSSSPPPHRFQPTFSPGGWEGAEIRFSPARRIPTARARQGAHSPTRRTQPPWGEPQEPEGGLLRAEGARVPEKPAAATGMPGPVPAPPAHAPHWSSGPAPPRGRAQEAPPPSGSGGRRCSLPLHVRPGCCPGSLLRIRCRSRLLRRP